MSTKRALLIGIAAYPHVPPLKGSVNDTHLMRSLLVDRFGFDAARITMLTDGQATRHGILSAFDALVDATQPGDIVTFHYAGHGSRIADREGDEPSGFDSTIVPFDATRQAGDVLDITDDEIQLRVEALAEKAASITLVFDACHSGTITRDDFGERARSIDADPRAASELPSSPIPADRRPAPRASGPSGWMPRPDTYVLIAGCRDDELSYEYRPPEGGGSVVHGALTYFLCQQLRLAPPQASYRDVFERTATLVNAVNVLQHPQMEGRTDRELFGVTDLSTSSFVSILEREDVHVLLAAGAAHGTTVGSTYRVFPQGTRNPEANGEIGEVEVTDVQAVTAVARITREASPHAIAPDARAFEHAHVFVQPRLQVTFGRAEDAAGADAEAYAALRAKLEASRLVSIVEAARSASASICIYRLPARTTVSASSPVPQARELTEPRWAVVDATGELLMPLKALDDIGAIVENLERIARYRRALAIDNPNPASRLRGRFTVALQVRGSDKRWSPALAADDGRVVFEEGQIVRAVIESRHEADVFVSVYDFGISGKVQQIYPPKGAQEILRAHGEVECPAQRLGFPDTGRDATGRSTRVEGHETVRLFVTEQPTSFLAFEQEAVRDEAPAMPQVMPQAGEDWTTASITFVLRRRAAPERITP